MSKLEDRVKEIEEEIAKIRESLSTGIHTPLSPELVVSTDDDVIRFRRALDKGKKE